MEKYKITVSNSAEKILLRLSKEVVPRIVKAIQALAVNPYPVGCRKLSGEEHAYRIRVQNYRIIYEVHHAEIEIKVLKIGHRKDIYR